MASGENGLAQAVGRLERLDEAPGLSYLRLSGLSVGPLINVNLRVLKDGIRRVVDHFGESFSAFCAVKTRFGSR